MEGNQCAVRFLVRRDDNARERAAARASTTEGNQALRAYLCRDGS